MAFYNLHAIVLQELFVDGIFPINLRHVHVKYLRSKLVNHTINRVRMEKILDLYLYPLPKKKSCHVFGIFKNLY